MSKGKAKLRHGRNQSQQANRKARAKWRAERDVRRQNKTSSRVSLEEVQAESSPVSLVDAIIYFLARK